MNRRLFFQHIAQTSEAPLALDITEAKGCRMTARDGKSYLDLISGISVSNLGHQNQAIKDAIIRQLDNYSHLMVYGEFIHSPQVEFAQWLSDHLPGKLESTYFTTSGSEAVEGAVKLAKRYTGRTEIISFRNSYHGSTQGALSLGNNEERRNAFRPLIPGNRILDYNSTVQPDQITEQTAAVILEIVQSEAGVISATEEFIHALRIECNESGALLIFDECQTGMGRTGKLFAFEHYNVIPDVLILAKAFGGGLPLGCFISSKEIMDSFMHQPVLGHLTTFGGNPVCCAAGLAAAEQLMSLNLIDDVERKANLFRNKLNHKAIKTIRNAGLLMAIEFESAAVNFDFCNQMLQRGVLADWFLFAPHCMRIAPPLIIDDDDLNEAASLINSL